MIDWFISAKALFLDRDGVINLGAEEWEYITTIEDFKWAPGVVDLIRRISDLHIPIFVITNQQCVWRGMMTQDSLMKLHGYMIEELWKQWWHISQILFCPHLRSEQCDCRKPKPGMILSILKQFPLLDPSQCLFVWDSQTDIEAWVSAWVHTLLIDKDKIINYCEIIISFF